MDAFLDSVIAFISNNRTSLELLFIFFGGLLSKVLIAIGKVHEISKRVTEMTAVEKMSKATDDVVSMLGARFTWLLMIPGVKTFIQFLIQYVFDRIKAGSVKND